MPAVAGAIDCHAHFIPKAVVRALRNGKYAAIDVRETSSSLHFSFPGLPISPPAPIAISDLDEAQRWSDEYGVGAQIFGPWTDMFGYTLEARDADPWTRAMNEAMAEVTTESSRVFGLGTISLQCPDLVKSQLAQVSELGLRGVMIGTTAPGYGLDEPRLDQVWEALVDLQLPAFVHPIFVGSVPEPNDYGLANAVGRSNATTSAIARLLFGGVLLRHPDLKLVVAHGGASVPFLLARLCRNHAINRDAGADPTVGFEKLFFDSVVLDGRVLRALLSITGPSKVVLGSDWPFPWAPNPIECVDDAMLSSEVRDQVLHGNAQQLFRIPDQESTAWKSAK